MSAIKKVEDYLATKGRSHCILGKYQHQEKGRGVKLNPSPKGRRDVLKLVVDGCLFPATQGAPRCDCMYISESPGKVVVFLVELKGVDVYKALAQLESTRTSACYEEIIKIIGACAKRAVAVVSPKVKIGSSQIEAWEKENPQHRLRVVHCKDDDTYDLAELLKQP